MYNIAKLLMMGSAAVTANQVLQEPPSVVQPAIADVPSQDTSEEKSEIVCATFNYDPDETPYWIETPNEYILTFEPAESCGGVKFIHCQDPTPPSDATRHKIGFHYGISCKDVFFFGNKSKALDCLKQGECDPDIHVDWKQVGIVVGCIAAGCAGLSMLCGVIYAMQKLCANQTEAGAPLIDLSNINVQMSP